jgi:peptide/nickel transport system permease protein
MERTNILRQFTILAKKDFNIIFSLIVIFAMVFFSIFGEYVAPGHYTDVFLTKKLQPPSFEHPFGTDFLGRDILSMIILGCRVALLVTLIPALVSAVIGVSIGIISGYVGGLFDDVVQRGVDILMGFPGLLLALAIINVLGPGLWNAMYSVTIGRIPGYIRLSRSLTFSIKETGFVEYSKGLGANRFHIMSQHILPNILTPIIVQLTFAMPGSLISVASLSFLGLGPNPPTPDWGVLMQQSRRYLVHAPWAAIIPGTAIFLISFAFNIMGETLRDITDPRRKYITF